MTPQGHMFAGWITFSAFEEGGATVAQAQVLMRAQDPLTEVGLTLGGHRKEDAFWAATLRRSRARFGVEARAGDEGRSASTGGASGRARATSATTSAFRSSDPHGDLRRCAGARGVSVAEVDVGRGRRRLGAERPRRGDRPRPRRVCGARARGPRTTVGGGMRSAELTLPGFAPRRLLGDPSARRRSPFLGTLPLAEHGVEWIESPAALAHPFDDGTAALLERSVEATRRDARRRRGARTRRLIGAARRASGRAARRPARAARAFRGIRSRSRASAVRAALPATALARARLSRRAGARALRGARRALDAAAVAAADGGVRARARRCSATRSAGRSPAAARSSSPTRSPRYLRLARRRDRDGPARRRRSPSSAARGGAARRRRRAQLVATRRRRARRPRTAAASSGSATGPASSSSTGRSTAPIPWRAAGVRARRDRAPRRDARGDRRVRARAVARRRRASGRSCCSPSRACSTRPARPRASTPRGRTATSRTARPPT